MLVLGVRPGDYVMFGDNIKVTVMETGGLMRLSIEAPRDVTILRGTVYERNQEQEEARTREGA